MFLGQKKKVLVAVALGFFMVMMQSFAYKDHNEDEMKPKNLQVLPQNISRHELIEIMKGFSKSLGVDCGFCHVRELGKDEQGRPKYNFASDLKPQKHIARGMIKMVDSINALYLDKIATPGILEKMNIHFLEHISCVTCHNGHKKPINKIDELKDED